MQFNNSSSPKEDSVFGVFLQALAVQGSGLEPVACTLYLACYKITTLKLLMLSIKGSILFPIKSHLL